MIQYDGYRPGSLADIVGLHARNYAADWGFGIAFEAKVAGELAAFADTMRSGIDLLLCAYRDGRLVGSIVIDAHGADDDSAHLRWFIVDSRMRGAGIGKELMMRAMAHCDAGNVGRVWLTTFAGLDAARALYEQHGFALVFEPERDQWGGGVLEQRFERLRPSPARAVV